MINLQHSKPFDIYLPNVYRYMDKEHIDLFFEKGILRISSFKKFKEYPDEIRGDKNEGNGSVTGASDSSGFSYTVMSGVGSNAYMLCGSIIDSESIRKELDTKTCFRITNPLQFSVAVSNAILGFMQSFQGFCNYKEHRLIKKIIPGMDIKDFTGIDGNLIIGGEKQMKLEDEIIGNGIDLMFLKEKKYQPQCEYRFVWTINTKYYQMQDYIDIECKEAIQFCEMFDGLDYIKTVKVPKLLILDKEFEPFVSSWGVNCIAAPCKVSGEDKFLVPDGWQEELIARKIPFREVFKSEVTDIGTPNF